MTKCRVLDGKMLAKQIRAQIKLDISVSTKKIGRPPGLAVILVGDDPASATYVASKGKAAREAGFEAFDTKLPASVSFDQIAEVIKSYNSNPQVDGILVQLPLPKGLDTNRLIAMLDPKKDVDGLHPYNQGLLMRGEGALKPCTPLGVMKLIDLAFSEVGSENHLVADLSGKSAVVLGRSILVGKAVALLLLERNATVTVAHSRTQDLPAVCRTADIIVAAVGKPNLVRKEWINPGAVVIDVGINRLPTGSLCGDVAFEEVAQVCSAITPVPGGVGPMTIAMLLRNTFEAWKGRYAS